MLLINMEKYDNTYNYICRVCLKQSTDKNMVSLSEKLNKRGCLTFGKLLKRFAIISTDYNDFLPTRICQNCKQMVQNINSFTIMCRTNDKKLRKFVNMAQSDREKCMQMICEYSLFRHYFPSKDFENQVSLSTSIGCDIQEQIGKIKSPNEHIPRACLTSDYNKICSKFVYNSDSDYLNDSILLDNNQNESCSESNVDIFLDSVEKVVQTDIPEKKQYKTRNNVENIDILLDTIEKAVNTRVKQNNIKTRLKNHQRLIEKKIHCDICNYTLATRFTYNYHMQRHTKYNYICDQCGRGFPGKEPLNRHLVKNHDKGPSLLCNSCPFKCSRRFDLVEHIRIHTGERPFTCEKCGLTFRRKAIWTNHLIKHKEKSISCNICQKKFHRQSDLTGHLNSVHERMFLFLCSVCDTSFAKGGTVRKHMLAKHNIPRDKQGKIKRVTKESNSLLFMENRNDNFLSA